MTLEKENYIPRLVDEKVEKFLKVFGAVSIEGPKWCGKTWTGLRHAETVSYLTDNSTKELAQVDPKYIFTDKKPQLLDEWQVVPQIWDAVRHACDESGRPGNFILTGSTSLEKSDAENEVYHSGTGRITTLRMQPMSLLESGDSTGEVSLKKMLDGDFVEKNTGMIELPDIASIIVRGGWPSVIKMSAEDASEVSKSYIDSVVSKDIHERKDRKRDSEKMRMLIKSLARNESSVARNDTLVRDIESYEGEKELIESRHTVTDYLGVLESLYLTANQPSFSLNYRSSERIGKSAKRHLVDPSLSCAVLGLSPEKLMQDYHTFGLMFESLVERDLRIYAEYLDGKLYHFRDNTSGDEVDAIVEFSDGRYGAIEIKLADNAISDAKKSLVEFRDKAEKKPDFMCIVVGHIAAAYRDPETGIYIVPFLSLGA
ncbi:ATP-binding protein [Candidatus Saccharibacteria bacterium]|nr:ATP-binding protein [Candidatus Saccharibacteria bacterium]